MSVDAVSLKKKINKSLRQHRSDRHSCRPSPPYLSMQQQRDEKGQHRAHEPHAGSETLQFFFSSRRRHTRLTCDWSSDVCSSDLPGEVLVRVAMCGTCGTDL